MLLRTLHTITYRLSLMSQGRENITALASKLSCVKFYFQGKEIHLRAEMYHHYAFCLEWHKKIILAFPDKNFFGIYSEYSLLKEM